MQAYKYIKFSFNNFIENPRINSIKRVLIKTALCFIIKTIL